jgi:hypothetical protein
VVTSEQGGLARLRLHLSSGRDFALSEGVRIGASELGVPGQLPTMIQTKIAEVVRNPNEPTMLGLRNLTGQPWSAIMPSGEQRRIETGRSLRLAENTTIDFGSVTGTITASTEGAAEGYVDDARDNRSRAWEKSNRLDEYFDVSKTRLSIWWLIVPTLVYAISSLSTINTLVLTAIAASIKFAQTRPELPASLRGLLPLLQSAVVLVFMGCNVIAVISVAVVTGATFVLREQLVGALAPWWQIQQRIPTLIRWLLVVALTLGIGAWCGHASFTYFGPTLTLTLISVFAGAVVTFLLTFTPPVVR